MLKDGRLVLWILDLGNRPQHPLGDRRAADHVGKGQDVLLDLGRKAEQAYDLGHAGARDARSAGDGGLVGDFAGV